MDKVIIHNIAHIDDMIIKLELSKMRRWLLIKLNQKLIKISKMVRKEINKDSLNDLSYEMDMLSILPLKKRKRKSL